MAAVAGATSNSEVSSSTKSSTDTRNNNNNSMEGQNANSTNSGAKRGKFRRVLTFFFSFRLIPLICS